LGPKAKAGRDAKGSLLGCARGDGLQRREGKRPGGLGRRLRERGKKNWAAAGLGWKGRRRVEGKRKSFQIFKLTQANEFKQRFEFKHSGQCTSMYATGNFYISLLN
jgi:hypothetical protein